jgi:hypothetical protein
VVDVALDCGAPLPKQQREASASAHDDDDDDEAILVSFQVLWVFLSIVKFKEFNSNRDAKPRKTARLSIL